MNSSTFRPSRSDLSVWLISNRTALKTNAPTAIWPTSTPVSEDYHVPFKFTGKLFGVAIKPGEEKLSAEDQKTIDEMKARIGLSR